MDKSKRKGDVQDVDKTQVLQDAKQSFRDPSTKPKKQVAILTDCLHVLMQGERLTPSEATDLFFDITKLFQYNDKDAESVTLRRLTYIGIKALSQQAENIYVVTSSLINDINSTRLDPATRASALRTLCHISDASTFSTIERYLKQSIVDKHHVLASAALTSLMRIASFNTEVVRRCTNEIQAALNSDSPMVQYHALCLRYNSCMNDKLAVSRLISNCIQQGLKSPLAICLLIRIITDYIGHSTGEETKEYRDYVKNNLNHHSQMVEYEAADALVSMKPLNEKARERKAAVAHLKNLLNSSKASLRFAAVRSLNKLALTAPADVRECNLDLENLMSQADCNRSIAILAITTLLKTGTESSVEKFLKHIGEFLSEIDDGFKVIVVSSIRQLCQKYPSKHPVMMDFLTNMLREEGGYAYKKAIVETIIKMIEDNEETKEMGLVHLCEFIEDCEHISLAVEVSNLIGREGPMTKKASTYIRFIANRLLLDAPAVTCSAITALAKFAINPSLNDTIKTALDRFSFHEDHEVMERALFYKNILSFNDESLNRKFIMNPPLKISYADLETKLMRYIESDCSESFNISKVAVAELKSTAPMSLDINMPGEDVDDEPKVKGSKKPASSMSKQPPNIFDDFDLGDCISSTEPTPLTDSVSEFGVNYIAHIYESHLVFEFECTNTVNNMCLENLTIEMYPPEGFGILAVTECHRLAFEEIASIFMCIEITDPNSIAYFTNIFLKYNYRIVDPDTNEADTDTVNEDIFPLDDIEVMLPNQEQ